MNEDHISYIATYIIENVPEFRSWVHTKVSGLGNGHNLLSRLNEAGPDCVAYELAETL